jgi:hypothetical protein
MSSRGAPASTIPIKTAMARKIIVMAGIGEYQAH